MNDTIQKLKKMKFIYSTSIVVLTMFLFSCGGAPDVDIPELDDFALEDEEEEVSKEPIEVTWDELNKRDFVKGQVLIFKSFVLPLSSSLYYSGGEIPLDFHERRHQSDGYHLRVDVPIGTGANQIKEIPSEYNPMEDVIIYTEGGGNAKVGDYVEITGVWSEASDDGYDYLDLTGIKVLEYDGANAIADDVPELTDALIEGKDEIVYAYIDATMELSMFMSSFDQVNYTIDLSQSNNKYLTKAYIMMGTGPSTMNVLESNFSESDFIVRDNAGNEMGASGKQFRLYGTFEKSDYDKEQKGNFQIEEIVAQ